MSRIPYVDPSTVTDREILGYLERARREGTPRPESQAVRAHNLGVIRAFSQAWELTFRNGVCRGAQWRASQVTMKEPDYVSTGPPIIRTAGFPRSGWKSGYSESAFPVPPGPNPGRRLVCARLP
jgi:hypothetical protein